MSSRFDDEEKLCQYLRAEIFPQIAPPPYGEIKIKQFMDQKPVYLIHEQGRGIKVVGKLFDSDYMSHDKALRYAKQGFHNLKWAREQFGMDNGRYRVVAPLGINNARSPVLITEMAPGKILDHYVARAIYEEQSGPLFDKLTCLAQFFAKLHQNSETKQHVSPDLPRSYLRKLLHSLQKHLINSSERHTIEKYARKWWDQNDVFADYLVTVHGDATPTNFFIYHHDVIGIDLEKMKCADRCWDLGFMAAELKHHFMWRRGDGWAAEPFIGHFLWEYARTYDEKTFFMITRKLPLYMSLGLLRIARNTWLDEPHRRNLALEAKRCLKYGR